MAFWDRGRVRMEHLWGVFMRTFLTSLTAALVLSAVSMSFIAYAADMHVGTIVATTTKNNSDTAAPFTLNEGGRYAVQCDAAAYYQTGKTSGATAVAATAVELGAKVLFDIPLPAGHNHIAILSVSGTATCKVFAVVP